VTFRLNGGGATLLGPAAAAGSAAALFFDPLLAPVFLVCEAFFGLVCEGVRDRCVFGPALVVCFSSIATAGRTLTLGFAAPGAALPDEPLWPEAPVEPGEPVVPEPVLLGVLGEPVLLDGLVEVP
jgi:hypothetical protein